MAEMIIPIPEGLPQTLKMSQDEFNREAHTLLAVKLYELGKVSSGVAAQVAGMDRLTFLSSLVRYRVAAINLQDEEVVAEIEAARRLAEE